MGYQINEYDWCVMKNIINNKKFTILQHIDGLKISHVDPDIASSVVAGIDAEYRKILKMRHHYSYKNKLSKILE